MRDEGIGKNLQVIHNQSLVELLSDKMNEIIELRRRPSAWTQKIFSLPMSWWTYGTGQIEVLEIARESPYAASKVGLAGKMKVFIGK
jgi:hypothetical protein